MKTNETNETAPKAAAGSGIRKACMASCHKILDRLARAKESIFAESRAAFESQERLLRLALNEAEAVAWQTMYPYLVFPTLAEEKVQAVAAWTEHQRKVSRAASIESRAA